VLLLAFVFSSALTASVEWVRRPADDSELVYAFGDQGERVPDFSMVGCDDVAVADEQPVDESRIVRVAPCAGDNAPAIQAAIDRVGAWSADARGFRGWVWLSPGRYDLAAPLLLAHDGVGLRGSAAGRESKDATVLRATYQMTRPMILIRGGERRIGESVPIVAGDYPVGSWSVRIEHPAEFKVGQTVVLTRQATASWIAGLGMDRLPAGGRADVVQWTPVRFAQRYERDITAIVGDRLFFHAPLVTDFSSPDGAPHSVSPVRSDARVRDVIVRSLCGETAADPEKRDDSGHCIDESRAETMISVANACAIRVEDVAAHGFWLSAVEFSSTVARSTARAVRYLDAVGRITGGRRYPFRNDGELNLMTDMEAIEGRHDFVNNVPSRGPNVFHDGRTRRSWNESGPHQRWSTGTLYDSLAVDQNDFGAYNRGNYGTGHGWAGATMVFWNCAASGLDERGVAAGTIVQNPPGARNWAIGGPSRVKVHDEFGAQPPGFYEGIEHTASLDEAGVEKSLYLAQSRDRVRRANKVRLEFPLEVHAQARVALRAPEVALRAIAPSCVARIALVLRSNHPSLAIPGWRKLATLRPPGIALTTVWFEGPAPSGEIPLATDATFDPAVIAYAVLSTGGVPNRAEP